MNSVAWW